MQLSGSTRVASTAECPDGDVAQCRIPNKEIVGRILLACDDFQRIWVKGRGCPLDRRLENRKGNLSLLNKMAYGEFTAALLLLPVKDWAH